MMRISIRLLPSGKRCRVDIDPEMLVWELPANLIEAGILEDDQRYLVFSYRTNRQLFYKASLRYNGVVDGDELAVDRIIVGYSTVCRPFWIYLDPNGEHFIKLNIRFCQGIGGWLHFAINPEMTPHDLCEDLIDQGYMPKATANGYYSIFHNGDFLSASANKTLAENGVVEYDFLEIIENAGKMTIYSEVAEEVFGSDSTRIESPLTCPLQCGAHCSEYVESGIKKWRCDACGIVF